jgi:anti-anti-sigma regulatory factor
MNQSTVRRDSSSGEPHLVIATIMSDEMNSVVEMHGVVRRSTVSELAAGLGAESGARPVSVVIDLTNVTVPNHWLLSSLAKANAVVRARKGIMRLLIGDDEMFELIHLSGFDRMAPMFLDHGYGENLAGRVGARRARANDRQHVVDLTEAGTARNRGRVMVTSRHPARWSPTPSMLY